jgi:hypothetical protein
VGDSILDELEEYARSLPEGEHQPHLVAEAMAGWFRGVDAGRRKAVLQLLPTWFETPDIWKATIALELAVLLGNARLVDGAIAIARRRDDSMDDARFLASLRLALIAAVKRVPTEAGIAYLAGLADRDVTFEASEDRTLSARAQLALCFLEREAPLECLERAVERVRSWQDRRVARSAFGALDVWTQEAGIPIDRLLTEQEQRLVRRPGWRALPRQSPSTYQNRLTE